MKKILFSICILLAIECPAQLMHISFGGHFYKQKGMLLEAFDPGSASGVVYYSTDVNESSAVPGAGFYYYQGFYRPSDNLSLGLQSGFDFSGYYKAATEVQNQYGQQIGETGGSDLILGYYIPIYAMCRIGAQAAKETHNGFGAALGAGINFFGFQLPNESGFMIPFTVAAELTFNQFGIRMDVPLKKFESHYSSYTGDIPRLSNSFFSVELTMQFGD